MPRLGKQYTCSIGQFYQVLLSKNETWDKSTKNDWDFLFSEEADAIKREVLKYTLDKIAFYVDPETIKNFMEVEKDK